MRRFVLTTALLTRAPAPPPAHATWTNDPATSNPVAEEPSGNPEHSVLSDGAGGVFVAWRDTRSGQRDIYAQHLLASGALDPAWPATGLAVCTATNSQKTPQLAS